MSLSDHRYVARIAPVSSSAMDAIHDGAVILDGWGTHHGVVRVRRPRLADEACPSPHRPRRRSRWASSPTSPNGTAGTKRLRAQHGQAARRTSRKTCCASAPRLARREVPPDRRGPHRPRPRHSDQGHTTAVLEEVSILSPVSSPPTAARRSRGSWSERPARRLHRQRVSAYAREAKPHPVPTQPRTRRRSDLRRRHHRPPQHRPGARRSDDAPRPRHTQAPPTDPRRTPVIPDDAPDEVKDALALANATAVEGVCPACRHTRVHRPRGARRHDHHLPPRRGPVAELLDPKEPWTRRNPSSHAKQPDGR